MNVYVQFVLEDTIDKIWAVEFENASVSYHVGDEVQWMGERLRVVKIVHLLSSSSDKKYFVEVWVTRN